MPTVSVVIPVFGVERFLRATLDSVLSQTLSDIEVICIDDAGTDACPQILDEYAARDARMQVIHLPENRRQGYGRNLGLSHATGEYVYFLDADDMIEPHALETLVAAAMRDRLDGIYFDSRSIYDNEELEHQFSGALQGRAGTYPAEAVSGPTLFEAFHANGEWSVLVQLQLWRRSFLLEEGIEFPAGAEHEDQLFSITAALAAKRVRYLHEQLLIRRFRPNSVVTTPPAPKNFHGYLTNTCKLIRFVRERGIEGRWVDWELKHLMHMTLIQRPVFEGEDPHEWFAADGLEDSYLLFDLVLKTQESLLEEDRKIFEPLTRYRSIAIYGAGRVGQSVFARLCKLGLKVDEFVVTSLEGNPERLLHRDVVALDDFTPAEGEIVLVAMAKGNHAAVSAMLQERGIRHFCYARNVLTGEF